MNSENDSKKGNTDITEEKCDYCGT